VLSGGKCTDISSDDDGGGDDDGNPFDIDDQVDDDDDDDDNEIPDEVDDFLDDEDIEALEEAGLIIYPGDDPPDIEGSYYLDSIEIAYDDLDLVLNIADYTYTFYGQTNKGKISMDYEAPEVNDQATGVGAFISGRGDCFSIFIGVEGDANGCEYENPSIISGCLDNDGITGWENGFIMGEKSGDNCEMLVETGHRRIIEESDNLAVEIGEAPTVELESAPGAQLRGIMSR
jgi:hypothetical protein